MIGWLPQLSRSSRFGRERSAHYVCMSTRQDLYVTVGAVLQDLLVTRDEDVPERPGCCDEYAIGGIAGRLTGQSC